MIRKTIKIILIVVLIGIIGFSSSCVRITTEEYAAIKRTSGTIDIIVRGFVAGLLTPEGPFPKWSRRLQIKIKNPELISEGRSYTFSANPDFTSRYNKVESGTLTIDFEKNIVILNVKYTDEYSFESINGEYAIRDR